MATIRKRTHQTKTPWQVMIRLKDCQPESKSFRTEKQAQAWAEKREAELKYGVPASTRRKQKIAPYKLSDILNEARQENYIKETHITGYKRLLQDHIATLYMDEITEEHTLKLYNRLRGQLSPSSVARYFQAGYKAWSYAKDIKKLSVGDDPFKKITQTGKNRTRQRRLTPLEEKKIKEFCLASPERGGTMTNLDLWQIIQFLIETGLRRAELTRINTSHISGGKGEQYLTVSKTKTANPRIIPLSPCAQKIISNRKSRGFTHKVFPYQPSHITRRFHKLTKKCDIDDLRVHDLRHEALSRLDEKGLSNHEMMLISGHKDVKNLQIYVNPTLKKVADKLWHSSRTKPKTSTSKKGRGDGRSESSKEKTHKKTPRDT